MIKQIHTNIKEAIEAEGFIYQTIQQWLNMELGILPTALKNRGFTVYPVLGSECDTDSDGETSLLFSVEFILKTTNDLYLDVFDEIKDLMESIEEITVSDTINVSNGKLFNCTNLADYILIQYQSVKFEY